MSEEAICTCVWCLQKSDGQGKLVSRSTCARHLLVTSIAQISSSAILVIASFTRQEELNNEHNQILGSEKEFEEYNKGHNDEYNENNDNECNNTYSKYDEEDYEENNERYEEEYDEGYNLDGVEGYDDDYDGYNVNGDEEYNEYYEEYKECSEESDEEFNKNLDFGKPITKNIIL
ncbi:3990_t:CDS:2 [Racocetra fulgida]|uniref:3990_t:CDS:1 n=1 Tax=Racocetra fulgida TaxID=60492 RepID=A0A9N8VYD5_9GLOM|nr:3990_t:CDS:2 [Racocetra fulgida]